MGKPRLASVLLAAVLVTAAVPLHALVHFDFEQKYFNEPPQPVLDHCVVEEAGIFHLFYLRGNPAVNIGHATTTDFIHWEVQPPVLEPGEWDGRLWAPHVIERHNAWYMFYTGVNSSGAQQAGLALSSYLPGDGWWKWPLSPVYHPDPSWAEWSETYFTHGRDPHIVAHNGKYYMFNTAKTWWNRGAVACAESNDLLSWTDIGPVFVNTTWHVLESVFIMFHNNKWHMFFTEETVLGTSHMSSDSLLEGWDIANRIMIDPGHAPQVTVTTSGDQMFSRHAVYNDNHGVELYNIRFDRLKWIGDYPAVDKPWALASDWNNVHGMAFTFQPTFGDNPYVRGDTADTNHEGLCWIGTKEYFVGPLGFGAPGATLSDTLTGMIRSNPFSITGNSMNLLVGGGNYPTECYVALIDNDTGDTLFTETGRNTEHMDRRYWDLVPHVGKTVYIEIADLSAADFGHINVDDIVESMDQLDPPGNEQDPFQGDGSRGKYSADTDAGDVRSPEVTLAPGSQETVLHPNVPNPFNPMTTISFELAQPGWATLEVYDVRGKHVRTLVDERVSGGRRDVEWSARADDGSAVGSGIYFYRLVVDGRVVQTRKMVLLK